MKVIVYHSLYGCETGCCGHIVELEDGRHRFEFGHARSEEEIREYAKNLVENQFGAEHVKDLDWENCEIKSYESCLF